MPILESSTFSPNRLLRNQHLATLAPFLIRKLTVKYRRERIDTPDGDFLDLDWVDGGEKGLVVITHGLGGDTSKPYMLGMAKAFSEAGWTVLTWHLRSCSGEPNRLPRYYYGGDSPDLLHVIQHGMRVTGRSRVSLVGFSLGGNITLRLLGEQGAACRTFVDRAVVFSTPVDLGASAAHLATGTRRFYMKFFIYEYRKKLRAKHRLMPEAIDLALADRCVDFRDFDQHLNAPWYGFRDADDFYENTSAKQVLHRVEVPALIVNAKDDPFLPPECYPIEACRDHPYLFLEMPDMGGHVGFFNFERKGLVWSERRAVEWVEG